MARIPNKKSTSRKEIPTHRFPEADMLFTYTILDDIMEQDKLSKERPHRHNFYEVFLFTRGGGTHMIDFIEYPILPDHLHFISPGMVHMVSRTANCTGEVITFTEELYRLEEQQHLLRQIHLYHNHQLPPIISCTKSETKRFLDLFHQIHDESESSDNLRLQLVLSFLTALLIQANRIFIAANEINQPQLFTDDRIQAFKNLLDQPFTEKPTVRQFASQLNLTVRQLTELIQRHTGLSPMDHIKDQLLIEAKRLLVNTDNSVKEIAFALYYEDPAYFGRFFRINTGLSPLEFRERMRKMYHT